MLITQACANSHGACVGRAHNGVYILGFGLRKSCMLLHMTVVPPYIYCMCVCTTYEVLAKAHPIIFSLFPRSQLLTWVTTEHFLGCASSTVVFLGKPIKSLLCITLLSNMCIHSSIWLLQLIAVKSRYC